MKRSDIENVFDRIASQADKVNRETKTKRFYTISDTNRNGKRTTIGIYDYVRKKYVLSDVRSVEAPGHLKEMEELVNSKPVKA